MRKRLIVLAALTLGACTESDADTVEHPFSNSLVAITVEQVTQAGGFAPLTGLVTICQHAAWSTGGAGAFTVRELVDVQEASTSDGDEQGFLYVVLGVDEAWYGELGDEVVVRFLRGSYDSFTVNERFVMLLRGDTADWNEGFYSASPVGIFREVSGTDTWQGRGLNLGTDALREAVTAAYGSFEAGEFSTGLCGTVVDFERCPVVSLVPENAIRFDEPCQEEL